MGGTPEVQNCLFPVKQMVTTIIDDRVQSAKDFPSQGFVGVGSFDQNWGWLRYFFLSFLLSIYLLSVSLIHSHLFISDFLSSPPTDPLFIPTFITAQAS